MSDLSPEQIRALTGPLNRDRVATRSGLSYLEAWDVKAMLIKVFGFGGFSAETIDSKIIREEQMAQAKDASKINWAITAQATVRLTIHQTGAVYTETAVAGSKQPDYTESADMAIKSAESDALKRAAIYLGTQFGLSLYNNATTADVVRVVLAPGQKEALEGVRAERAAEVGGQAQAQVQRALGMRQERSTGASTGRGVAQEIFDGVTEEVAPQ